MNPIHSTAPRPIGLFTSARSKSRAMRRASANATAMMIMASRSLYLGASPLPKKKGHTSVAPKPCLSFRKKSRIAKSHLLTKSIRIMARAYAKRAPK
jgi:hypothetical protein